MGADTNKRILEKLLALPLEDRKKIDNYDGLVTHTFERVSLAWTSEGSEFDTKIVDLVLAQAKEEYFKDRYIKNRGHEAYDRYIVDLEKSLAARKDTDSK